MTIDEFNQRARQAIGRRAAYPDWTAEEAARAAGLLEEALADDDAMLRRHLLMIAAEHGLPLPEDYLWRQIEGAESNPQCRVTAAEHLLRSGTANQEPPERLLRAVADPENPARDLLIGLAGNRRAVECAAVLTTLVEARDEMALPALNALLRIDAEGAKELCAGLADDEDPGLRETARRGLVPAADAAPSPPPGVEALPAEELRRLKRESEYRRLKHNLNQAHHLAASGRVDLETLGVHYELSRQRLRRHGLFGAVREFFASPLPEATAVLRREFAALLLRRLPEITGGRIPEAAAGFLARRVAVLPVGLPEAWRVELETSDLKAVRIGLDKRFCDPGAALALTYKFSPSNRECILALTGDAWDEIELRCWCRDRTMLAVFEAEYHRQSDLEEESGS